MNSINPKDFDIGQILLVAIFSIAIFSMFQKKPLDFDYGYGYDSDSFLFCNEALNSPEAKRGCYQTVYEMLSGFDYFYGRTCTDDCSGHEAGYDWAKMNTITDEYDCITDSSSFTEGCLIYIEKNIPAK